MVVLIITGKLTMTDKKQNELQDLLKQGICALREMRRGVANACSDLKTVYSTKVLAR